MAKKRKETDYMMWFIYFSSAMIAVTFIYGVVVVLWGAKPDIRGTFGDSFGVLNALFSGIAIAGVIITIIMQMHELKETREELKRSANAQDESQKALKEQLKSMQLTSKIDILESYYKTLNRSRSEDMNKMNLAQNMIKSATEQMFWLDENIEYIKPNLTKPTIQEYVSGVNIHQLKLKNSLEEIKYRFVLSNKGLNFRISDIKIYEDDILVWHGASMGQEVYRNQKLELIYPWRNGITKIDMWVIGMIVPHIWTLTAIYKVDKDKVYHEIVSIEPTLISKSTYTFNS